MRLLERLWHRTKIREAGTMNRLKQKYFAKIMRSFLFVLAGASLASAMLILPGGGILAIGAVDSGNKESEKAKSRNKPSSYTGMSAASAAVTLRHGYFVVGNDEDNILRVYSTKEPDFKEKFKLSEYFSSIVDTTEDDKTDIEGATKLGKYIFWIGSHSRSNKGKVRPARFRLFAHKMKFSNGVFSFIPVGQPYTKLLDELIQDCRFAKYKLAEAAKVQPKAEGALSIEGLSASADKKTLLIGFRNPVTNNLALIVPLDNPLEVIEDGAQALFGNPVELDLGGYGIRDFVWWKGGKRFLILAGPFGENPGNEMFRLYQWTGQRGDKPQEINTGNQLEGVNAEAIVIHHPSKTDKVTVQILSDDEKGGSQAVANSFRSVWIAISK
jgi:hypothetical protein